MNGIYWYKWCCDRFSILPYEEVDDEDKYNNKTITGKWKKEM